VPAYLNEHGINYELIRADRFPSFARAYSPSGRIPAVTIVSKHGYLIDYQHGYSRRHLPRLVQALAQAEAPP
jgi:hypothetical protein